MNNLLSIATNLVILVVTVSLLWLLFNRIPEDRSLAYFIILILATCPLTAVILGASNNIINIIKHELR